MDFCSGIAGAGAEVAGSGVSYVANMGIGGRRGKSQGAPRRITMEISESTRKLKVDPRSITPTKYDV